MTDAPQPAERTKPDPYNGQTPGEYWHAQLEASEKAFEKWRERAKKVVKRYRDERDAIESQRKKFNILWSNVQVLFPSLYGRNPKPDVSRRYMDNDPPSRLASMMLERVISYEIENFTDFDSALRGAVEDRLLPGRGITWVRYEPDIVNVGDEPHASPDAEVAAEGAQITEDTEQAPDATPAQRVVSAHSPCDYVFWQDFTHSPARTWEEVWWVARWVYMTREEGEERFGDKFKSVPCESTNEGDAKEWRRGDSKAAKASLEKKAKVAEIWNKRTGKVCWVAKGYPEALDERADPLKLESFFPCPKPLYATTTTGSLVPIPDYAEYQDQANELDELTQRIFMLTKACKAVGVFNAEYKELQRLLNEGVDNRLFPVDAWAAFAEKGGLQGAVAMLDMTTVIGILKELYVARESVKQTIYEVTGLSDVLRGSTDASETATAQQLKANFGGLRLKSHQQDVARYASDLFKMKAEIICNFYPPELILQMSGVQHTQDGQDPQLVEAAMKLLKSTTLREFSIQVESDTLAQIDEQREREEATQFTQAVGTFFKDALPLVQAAPFMANMVGELLMFNVRRFRVGRPVEAAFDRAMQQMQQTIAQQQQQPPQEPPEVMVEKMKLQAQMQRDQAQMQMDGQKAAADLQLQRDKMAGEQQLERERMEREFQFEDVKHQRELDSRERLAADDTIRKVQDSLTSHEAKVKGMVTDAAHKQEIGAVKAEAQAGQDASQVVMEELKELGEAIKVLVEQIGKPKRIVRGPDGRAAGVETVQ